MEVHGTDNKHLKKEHNGNVTNDARIAEVLLKWKLIFN